MKKWFLYNSIALVLFGLSMGSYGREIQVPIQLNNELLRHILIREVYVGPHHTAQVWNDDSGCNSLVLSNPRVGNAGQQLRILSDGIAKLGTPIGNRCIPLLDWTGTIEVFQKPMLGPELTTLYFQTVQSNIYNAEGHKEAATGQLWDRIKEYVHPRLSQVRIDLQPQLAELRNLLPLVLSPRDRSRIQTAIDSLTLTEAQTTPDGIKVALRFTLPDLNTPPPSPEPPLSPEEMQRWEAAWQQGDAFLTFIIKQAAAENELAELRPLLLEILLDARHDIDKALTASTPGTADPIRTLFLKTWERLAPVLRHLSLSMPHETALHYLSFIAASDVLKTIDQLGPASGLDISTDGLRRLARIIAPQAGHHPLFYNFKVDPELRRLLGFSVAPSPSRKNSQLNLNEGLWRNAWAADSVDRPLISRLNQWVPTTKDMGTYLPMVHQLLDQTVSHLLQTHPLESQYHSLYRWLLLATAWQESCWRQFTKKGDKIRPFHSGGGSVGLMQINQNVWRGFYDVHDLNWDIAYNAQAGGEILLRYLVDYAIKKGEHKKTGDLDNLARATYAAYNGGPGHLRRYRKAGTPESLRKIDASFWDKYRTIKQGNELAVAQCFGIEASSLSLPPGNRR
ncbi:lytic transglycosylase domain-containing protein [Nitrosococcus oceani]|uniref:Transglycosylase SLT domain-containing protein n=2 Tax=Nitrosococcus oceani TaxID=1229 RepID=Q3J863_NITOC|nr:lytic transglycosylase domain-containing protein [Nitrosococcus oceani]KFI18572.1 lytic transglycosylase [Nitrosococcus oceani C-27]ABA58983.1 hypothetical protein Noc_2530 [Nitrosococcus oceani ATCC 19707]EDZ65276.1 hypothetical protein NOC27_1954 [Nitrosococcus oceani AFC27]KFI21800.1 lytic transglycosylase [Nitrosococcus oceani]GEM18921.1 lytic transglycosylase [Nitrosococcus oceani]